jgi:MYXO-CTERM domain-containing protein
MKKIALALALAACAAPGYTQSADVVDTSVGTAVPAERGFPWGLLGLLGLAGLLPLRSNRRNR